MFLLHSLWLRIASTPYSALNNGCRRKGKGADAANPKAALPPDCPGRGNRAWLLGCKRNLGNDKPMIEETKRLTI
jgi:hypothetical protein